MAEQKNRGSSTRPASFYTMWEVARMLDISRNTMREYIDKGDFSTVLPDIHHRIIKIGINYLMPKGLFDRYLKQGKFWPNTNIHGTAGRPRKWEEGQWKWFKFKISKELYDKLMYAKNKANSQSTIQVGNSDLGSMFLEEGLQRRPELMEGYED